MKLKVFYVILSLVAICLILVPFIFIGQGLNNMENNSNKTNITEIDEQSTELKSNEVEETEEYSKIEITEDLKLSDECDIVLATSSNYSDDLYELVANETEDYYGTEIEIGVIKNNEWLVPLSNDNPFLNEKGLVYTKKSDDLSVFDEDLYFEYCGNGCFYNYCFVKDIVGQMSYGVIYNSENGKCYDLTEHNDVWPREKPVESGGNYIMMCKRYDAYDSNNECILNTSTMELKELEVNGHASSFSEGLFCLTWSNKEGFYDENGKLIIDLSEYDISSSPSQNIYFINDECTFKILNDTGNHYQITINKNGDVISSQKID